MFKSIPYSIHLRILAAGCLIILLALGVRFYIFQRVAKQTIDPRRLPVR